MATIRAEEVRIPRHARDAVARHDAVVVLNRDRRVYVIVHPEDYDAVTAPTPRGRPLREALVRLADVARPDSAFADDMEDVLRAVGPTPGDPWARS